MAPWKSAVSRARRASLYNPSASSRSSRSLLPLLNGLETGSLSGSPAQAQAPAASATTSIARVRVWIMGVIVKRGEIIEEFSIEAATVPPELNGLRLDAGAARLFDRHSRSQLQRWIGQGHLRVNSRITQSSRQRLRSGDQLRLRVPSARPTTVEPQKIGLDVV